jgi:hypothetical protein
MIVIVLVVIMTSYIARREYLLLKDLRNKLDKYENKLSTKAYTRKQKNN